MKLAIKLHAKGTVNIVLTDSQQCPLTFNGSRYVAGVILVFLQENGLSFSTKVNCGYIERVFSWIQYGTQKKGHLKFEVTFNVTKRKYFNKI